MKILIPVDASTTALAPLAHIQSLRRAGVDAEVLLINVQPPFPLHVVQFSSQAARDALRAERSREALARAIEQLSLANVPFRAMAEVGRPAERIAVAAEREQVDDVMMGVGRHPAWLRWFNPSIAQGVMARTDIPVTVFARGHAGLFERYALPAGAAGLAALLLAGE